MLVGQVGQRGKGSGRHARGARPIPAAEAHSTSAASIAEHGPKDRAIGVPYARSQPRSGVPRLSVHLFSPPASAAVSWAAGRVIAWEAGGDPSSRRDE